MKCRALWFVSAVALLAGIEAWGRFDAQLYAAQDPVPRDRVFFTFNYVGDVTTEPSRMQPRLPFPRTSSTILIGANNTVCVIDGNTGRTSAPLQVYGAGAAAPVNFTAAEFDGQRVLFTAPANASPNPMAAFALGPPHQLLGDFGMIEGGHEFGVSLAAGNISGDATPELFFATATGGPGQVHVVSPGRDDVLTFSPFDPGYQGGIRLAAGDVNGDGFDDLIAGQAQGGEVRFFRFVDDAPVMMGSGFPFGPTPNHGPFISLFDVNNDGVDEAIFGTGDGQPLVRIVGIVDNEPRVFTQFNPLQGTKGVAVAGGLVNGFFAITVTPVNDVPEARQTLGVYHYVGTTFLTAFQNEPFGSRATRISIGMYPFSAPPPP